MRRQWCIQSFFGQTGTNIEPTLKGTFSNYVPPNAHKQVRKEIKREKQTFVWSIMYLNKWTLLLTISSFPLTSFCFIGSSILPAFLSFKPIRNNWMHCQIIDHYFNMFFVEIQLTKQNLKSDIWVSEFGRPNQYTGLPNGLYMPLEEDNRFRKKSGKRGAV